MQTKLTRIANIAKENPKESFTSLYHLLNEEMLTQCHLELDGSKATGVDQVTKTVYEENLESNIKDLVERLKRKSYRPQPVRRAYIPKDEKSTRPLGIPSYEDKIVQLGLNKILQAIYEQDFLNLSYGFRPGRNCHDTLKALNRNIEYGRTSYIVDADIRSFFTKVNHEWLMKFLGVRIGDPNIQRLIRRFLKAGIMEQGRWEPTEAGTPQGSIVSPVLANLYLHYALDLWFEVVVKKAFTRIDKKHLTCLVSWKCRATMPTRKVRNPMLQQHSLSEQSRFSKLIATLHIGKTCKQAFPYLLVFRVLQFFKSSSL